MDTGAIITCGNNCIACITLIARHTHTAKGKSVCRVGTSTLVTRLCCAWQWHFTALYQE